MDINGFYRILFGPSTLGAININDYIEGKVIPSVYINNTLTALKNCAMIGCGVRFAYLPQCQAIGESAFYTLDTSLQPYTKCLEGIYAPNVSIIGREAFCGTSITKAYFPKCEQLGSGTLGSVFKGCAELTEAYFPIMSYGIGGSTFANCAKLSNIYMPLVTSIGSSAFYSCVSLASISFPCCSTLYGSVF